MITSVIESRSEKRRSVPYINRTYVNMEINVSDAYVQTDLMDFSSRGLRFISPCQMDIGLVVECRLSIPASMSQKVHIKVKVNHYKENKGEYNLGGKIIDVSDTLWFEMFSNILTFIREREGEVY